MAIDKAKGMAIFDITEEIYDEMLGEFLEQADQEIKLIKGSVEAGKWDEIQTRIHALKGVSGNLRIDDCFHCAKDMEQRLKTGDRNGFAVLLAKLEVAVDEIRTLLYK